MAWQQTSPNGGGGGNYFSDDLTLSTRLAGFIINHGLYIDGIQGIYQRCNGKLYAGAWNGGQGGTQERVDFAAGEYITNITGRAGQYVDQITIQTNIATYGPYGATGGSPWSIPNDNIGGFYGHAGQYVDSIGFFYPCPALQPDGAAKLKDK